MIPVKHGKPLEGLLRVAPLWKSRRGKCFCGPYGQQWLFVWRKGAGWTLAQGPIMQASPLCELQEARRQDDGQSFLLGSQGNHLVLVMWNEIQKGMPSGYVYHAQTVPFLVEANP